MPSVGLTVVLTDAGESVACFLEFGRELLVTQFGTVVAGPAGALSRDARASGEAARIVYWITPMASTDPADDLDVESALKERFVMGGFWRSTPCPVGTR